MTTSSHHRPDFIDLDLSGRPLRLELAWVGAAASPHPTVVFLHEGLGSVALWKDFPARFCKAYGFSGLVYSRRGYGRSDACPPAEPLGLDFMQREACDVLPALLAALGLGKPWLFGHSDGASIALLYAVHVAACDDGDPAAPSGLVVMAPHVMVEDVSVASIAAARVAYLDGPLRARLARYHDHVDAAFWGWNDVWLDPAFRGWDMRADLPRIRMPVLAIQGAEDEYGTLEQVHAIGRLTPGAAVLVLPECGHSPYRDQPAAVIEAAGRFMQAHRPG